MGFGHLSKRFFGSLWPAGPAQDDTAWARAQLLPNERDLWQQMNSADRRHSIAVAQRVERALGHEASRPVLAAALLHDVGKIDARLGAYGRVVATLSVGIAGRSAAEEWSETRASRARSGSTRDTLRSGPTASPSRGATPSRSRGPASITCPRRPGRSRPTSPTPSKKRMMIEFVTVAQCATGCAKYQLSSAAS